jgi:hypothetical protein
MIIPRLIFDQFRLLVRLSISNPLLAYMGKERKYIAWIVKLLKRVYKQHHGTYQWQLHLQTKLKTKKRRFKLLRILLVCFSEVMFMKTSRELCTKKRNC